MHVTVLYMNAIAFAGFPEATFTAGTCQHSKAHSLYQQPSLQASNINTSLIPIPHTMPTHTITTTTAADSSVTLSHDTDTGAITVEFERLETADAVLPRFCLRLSTEHVAAWAGHVLRERWGRRCREITGRHDGPRFATALRLTASDSGLVFYTFNPEGVVVLRGGRVLKAPFRVEEGMGQFEGRLGEIAREDRQDASVVAEFVEFAEGMMG